MEERQRKREKEIKIEKVKRKKKEKQKEREKERGRKKDCEEAETSQCLFYVICTHKLVTRRCSVHSLF